MLILLPCFVCVQNKLIVLTSLATHCPVFGVSSQHHLKEKQNIATKHSCKFRDKLLAIIQLFISNKSDPTLRLARHNANV